MTLPLPLLLAAPRGAIVRFDTRTDQPGAALPWENVAIVLAIAAAVALSAWLAARWLAFRRKQNTTSPQRLLAELCRAHQLTRRQRRLVNRLAAHHHLPQPAALFVEPALWEAGELALSGAFPADDVQALRERLFSQAS
jgi:hypothetical protein